MRKNLVIMFVCLIFVIFQESFLLEFFGAALNPNLIIALCFTFIFIDDIDSAMFTALIGGLFLDFLGVSIVGLSSLILILLLVISRWMKKTVFRGIWVQIGLIIGSTIIFKLLMGYPGLVYSNKILFSGFLNSAISLVFYLILSKIRQRYLSTEYRIKA